MTKAKTKSRRVWVIVGPNGMPWPTTFSKCDEAVYYLSESERYDFAKGATVTPATLTWTPPAKAKKRSAKR